MCVCAEYSGDRKMNCIKRVAKAGARARVSVSRAVVAAGYSHAHARRCVYSRFMCYTFTHVARACYVRGREKWNDKGERSDCMHDIAYIELSQEGEG